MKRFLVQYLVFSVVFFLLLSVDTIWGFGKAVYHWDKIRMFLYVQRAALVAPSTLALAMPMGICIASAGHIIRTLRQSGVIQRKDALLPLYAAGASTLLFIFVLVFINPWAGNSVQVRSLCNVNERSIEAYKNPNRSAVERGVSGRSIRELIALSKKVGNEKLQLQMNQDLLSMAQEQKACGFERVTPTSPMVQIFKRFGFPFIFIIFAGIGLDLGILLAKAKYINWVLLFAGSYFVPPAVFCRTYLHFERLGVEGKMQPFLSVAYPLLIWLAIAAALGFVGWIVYRWVYCPQAKNAV